MKADQLVRSVSALGTVASYMIYLGLNGGGDVSVPALGTRDPFIVVLAVLLVLAFPELIDKTPKLPSRKQ